MNSQTVAIVAAAIKADDTIGKSERSRLLGLLRTPSADVPPRLVRFGEAARRLGVTSRTVRNLCRAGTLSRCTLPGRARALGVAEADVLALIAGQELHHDRN